MPFPSVRARSVTASRSTSSTSVRSRATARPSSSAMRRTSRSSPVIRPLMRRTAPCSIESQSILDVMVAWPVARMPEWQTGRHPQSAEMQLKPDVESIAIGETGGSGVDLVDLVDRVDQGSGDTGGLQRNLNCALLMFNALMRWSSVDGGTPSFDAAPDEPPTRPRHSASTASMVSRSLWAAP